MFYLALWQLLLPVNSHGQVDILTHKRVTIFTLPHGVDLAHIALSASSFHSFAAYSLPIGAFIFGSLGMYSLNTVAPFYFLLHLPLPTGLSSLSQKTVSESIRSKQFCGSLLAFI